MRLAKHNDMQMLASQSAALDCHKEFVMAVGSGQVTRIAPLVAASQNNHESISALSHRFYRASADTYREGPVYNPKGFTPDERMVSLTVLRLGGARLADILHRALGLPGLTTLRKHTVIRPLRASPGMPTVEEIEENIDAYTDGEDAPSGPPKIIHRVIMLDEIAVEKRVRWDDKTNMILGACREHSSKVPLEFSDIADAETFFHALDQGTIHLASEATVVAFGALSRDPHVYNPRPICISGTCKQEKGPDQAAFLRTLNAAANSRKTHGNIIYRTVSVASDGEAKRGLALAMEFMKSKLSTTSPIHKLLAPLKLMNLLVGPDDVTPDKDFRHVVKNERGLLMRKAGINVLGFLITPPIVKQHLLATGNTTERVNSLLNPNDKQDVPLGYQLLRELWDLPDAGLDDSPAFCRARLALKIFGRLGYHLLMPYICISLSLREQLVHLSTAAHLLFILFTTDGAGTDFMANQTFVNIMIMIKNAFFCVAKAKIDIPDSEFFLILLGTDRLEKLFGLIRTAVGTDANVDVYQLSTRASNLTEVSIILALRPHWDRGPRRIKLPAIINEKGDVSPKADHISPASCIGDLHVAPVVLHSCWMEGRRAVEGMIPGSRETLARCAARPSFDMLSPFGHLLVNPEPFYDADGDIEDAIAIEKPRNKNHSPHVTVDGKKVSKASILSRLMQGRSVRLSTDRTRRVAGVPAFKSPSNSLVTGDGDKQCTILAVKITFYAYIMTIYTKDICIKRTIVSPNS
ncbi:hypothetical protein FB451DRAFT_1433109 [Mycena latifolia]|nr:hypothetical protein FB451DRAFT_1433109 [Mycena latifolia]